MFNLAAIKQGFSSTMSHSNDLFVCCLPQWDGMFGSKGFKLLHICRESGSWHPMLILGLMPSLFSSVSSFFNAVTTVFHLDNNLLSLVDVLLVTQFHACLCLWLTNRHFAKTSFNAALLSCSFIGLPGVECQDAVGHGGVVLISVLLSQSGSCSHCVEACQNCATRWCQKERLSRMRSIQMQVNV